jgi:tetratricopeptide (TPR) repeat protein
MSVHCRVDLALNLRINPALIPVSMADFDPLSARPPDGNPAQPAQTLTWEQALAVCDEGIARYSRPGATTDLDLRRLAEAWLNRGQVLECKPETLGEAVSSYEKAIELLDRLNPGAEGHPHRHVLATAWLNRGNVLQRSDEPSAVEEATRSYQRAIVLLREAPADAVAERCALGTAWLNAGGAWQKLQTPAARAEGERALAEAIAVFRALPFERELVVKRLLAAALLNRAGILFAGPEAERRAAGFEAAQEVIEVLAGAEAQDAGACEIGLKARCLRCEVYSAALVADNGTTEGRDDLVAEATDTCEEALRFIENAERNGGAFFRPVAQWLFRLGVMIYAEHQPQFLGEYVREFFGGAALADARAELRASTQSAIDRVRSVLRERLFAGPKSPDAAKWVASLEDLQSAAAFLQQPAAQA